MRFSICNWTFGNIPIEQVFSLTKSAGYNYIDVQAKVDEFDWQEIKQLEDKYSLKVNGLLCDSGWPQQEHDLANKERANREKAVDYFKRQIECAGYMECEYLVVVPSAIGKYSLMGRDKSEDWKWAIESIDSLTETAQEHQVNLVVEAVNRYESCLVNNSEDLFNLVKEVNHPHVKVLLDTYHMNIEESSFREAILRVKDWLEVIHVADNNRMGIGWGHIDFKEIMSVLKEIGFDKTIALECTAPGPNPFEANKGEGTEEVIRMYAEESLKRLKGYGS